MTNQPLIHIHKLVKTYGLLPVLRQIDLDIQAGEFVTLLGSNGSGKSTLIRLLSGLTKPTLGTIQVGGWTIPDEAMAVRAQIGMVGHQSLLYENLTAQENLIFFARLYNLSKSEQQNRIPALLNQVGLAKRADSLVRTFSRGMQQRLSIARALLHEPHILLLDEPYTGLDQDASTLLDDILRQAHHDGQTLIMATHQLHKAVKLAERIIMLSKGKIVSDMTTAGLNLEQLTTHYADKTGQATAR